jgi:hypothetical protein
MLIYNLAQSPGRDQRHVSTIEAEDYRCQSKTGGSAGECFPKFRIQNRAILIRAQEQDKGDQSLTPEDVKKAEEAIAAASSAIGETS